MNTQAHDAAMFASRRFDKAGIGRLTSIGLFVAVIGWGLLLAEATVADILNMRLVRSPSATFHADLIEIAKCIIGSGFALAIVGVLQTGFGALDRFFGAVLMRSSHRAAPMPQVEPDVREDLREPARTGRELRPYRTLPDGSVEVDTILGTRRFETMAEARDFI